MEKSSDAEDATGVRGAAPAASATSSTTTGQSDASHGERLDTSADRKLNRALLDEIERQRGGEPLAPTRHPLATPDGTVRVDIEANVGPKLLDRIHQLGGTVLSSVPRFGAVQARIPVTSLRALALEPDVRSIRHAIDPITNSAADAGTTPH